jgi:glycine oxidase
VCAGLRPGTPDNAPLVGEAPDGVIWATGHHRNGILLTPATAALIAQYVLTGEVAEAMTPFGLDRFNSVMKGL